MYPTIAKASPLWSILEHISLLPYQFRMQTTRVEIQTWNQRDYTDDALTVQNWTYFQVSSQAQLY